MGEKIVVHETELWQYSTDSAMYFMFSKGNKIKVQPARWGEECATRYAIVPEGAKGVMLAQGKSISYADDESNPYFLNRDLLGFTFFFAGNRMLICYSNGQSRSHVFASEPTPAQVMIEANRLNRNMLFFETVLDNLYPDLSQREKMAVLQAVGEEFGMIPYRASKMFAPDERVMFTEDTVNNPLVKVESKGARGGRVDSDFSIGDNQALAYEDTVYVDNKSYSGLPKTLFGANVIETPSEEPPLGGLIKFDNFSVYRGHEDNSATDTDEDKE